ncbi:MAG: TetR family transcriptional regulator [Anaerolineales bacterium]|nr:TetR family transcriptional regulator [Anaerolineales bacterium]
MQDVTDKAQVNRATFYAHFQDKYALLDYSISQMSNRRSKSGR